MGGTLGMVAVGALSLAMSTPLLIAPFGSTCMMIFGAPHAPFAQPRNVIGGHLVCTLTSLAALRIFDSSPWAIAGAVGVAMGVMGLTRTFHPLAGGDCVVVMLVQPSWTFLFVPVLLGCLVLLAVALVFHKLSSREPYPLRGGPTAASSHAAPHAN